MNVVVSKVMPNGIERKGPRLIDEVAPLCDIDPLANIPRIGLCGFGVSDLISSRTEECDALVVLDGVLLPSSEPNQSNARC